jgi:hypothetical protein
MQKYSIWHLPQIKLACHSVNLILPFESTAAPTTAYHHSQWQLRNLSFKTIVSNMLLIKYIHAAKNVTVPTVQAQT